MDIFILISVDYGKMIDVEKLKISPSLSLGESNACPSITSKVNKIKLNIMFWNSGILPNKSFTSIHFLDNLRILRKFNFKNHQGH